MIDVRRERDIVLIPSLSGGITKEGDGTPGSPPADLEGKMSIDCGRDRGLDWVLDVGDDRGAWLTVLDVVVLEVSFRSGSTAGETNLDEVGGLSVREDWKGKPTGDEDRGRPVAPVGVSDPEERNKD